MLSNFPAMLPTDGQLPAIWDCPDFLPTMTQSPKPAVPSPTCELSPGSYELENPGSHEPDKSLKPMSTNSGKRTRPTSDSATDERKQRRMISNRDSARRSRMRKQKYIENLTNELNRLRMENRALSNRLRFVLSHCFQVKMDNERLRLEQVMLSQRLAEIRQVLCIRQTQEQFPSFSAWPCSNNNAYVASEQIQSLITY